MKKVIIFGTRPEAIKLYKPIKILNNCLTISTGQHKQLLSKTLNCLDIIPDIKINVMKKNQNLDELTSNILKKVTKKLKEISPDIVIVHGDTTTSFASALAAFYLNIKVAHIEAGLRTNNIYSPFPEELNRSMVAKIATYNFVPLESNKNNLLKENINESKIFITGNTAIDTLLEFSKKIEFPNKLKSIEKYLNNYILVTGHRRENFGNGFENICNALKQIANDNQNINIIYPVHLNPNVLNVVNSKLNNIKNIKLIEPQDYISFLYLMKNCKFILTDSGGIQEEAPTLNKPVLLMRDNSERIESKLYGGMKIIGTEYNSIVESVNELINNNRLYLEMSNIKNPYGDGLASERIKKILEG